VLRADDAKDKWLPPWRWDPLWPTQFSFSVLGRPDQQCMFDELSATLLLFAAVDQI